MSICLFMKITKKCRFIFQNEMLLFIIVASLSSCFNYKNISYFKNVSDSSYVYSEGEVATTTEYTPLIIQPDDILKITISTLEPEANGTLNLGQSSNVRTGIISSNVASSLSIENGNSSDGYLVNKEGNIEVPVLGTLHVSGLSTDMIKSIVLDKAKQLYKNPVVNVRLANFKITILGEVEKPGTYLINGERESVLDALGLAGDLTIYGKRENLILMRQQNNNEKKIVRLDLNNTSILSSPFFYLKQGDILYIEPTKGKAASTDAARTRTYTIIGTAISLFVVIASRLF